MYIEGCGWWPILGGAKYSRTLYTAAGIDIYTASNLTLENRTATAEQTGQFHNVILSASYYNHALIINKVNKTSSFPLTVFTQRSHSYCVCLLYCLEWYNGVANSTGAVMREQLNDSYWWINDDWPRAWNKCVKHCLECISSLTLTYAAPDSCLTYT